jgi:hypothetical protein
VTPTGKAGGALAPTLCASARAIIIARAVVARAALSVEKWGQTRFPPPSIFRHQQKKPVERHGENGVCPHFSPRGALPWQLVNLRRGKWSRLVFGIG